MRSAPLPSALERRWGNLPDLFQRGPNEWSSSVCPKCGTGMHRGGYDVGDRFRMFSDGKPRCYCRQCGYTDFADSDDPKFVITDDMRAAWIVSALEREHQAKEDAEKAIDALRREQLWLRYNETIDAFGRAWWYRKGVPDYLISTLLLGYCPSKTIWHNGAEYTTPSATIPVFAPGWELVNLRHRLINPPEPNDKYRPDRAGLPAALYLTNPEDEPSGECLLVEGEIKSIVVYDRLDMPALCIVGIPGKSPAFKMLDILSKCDRIHIILDPDAAGRAYKIAEYLGRKRARIVTLPVKPDDFFTMYGGGRADFLAELRNGRTL